MNRTAIWNRLMKREIPRFDLDRVYYFDEYNKAHNYGEQNITIPGVRNLLMKLEAARNVYTRDIEAMTAPEKPKEQNSYHTYQVWVKGKRICIWVTIGLLLLTVLCMLLKDVLPSKLLGILSFPCSFVWLMILVSIIMAIGERAFENRYTSFVRRIGGLLDDRSGRFREFCNQTYNKIDHLYLSSLDPAYREMVLMNRKMSETMEMQSREISQYRRDIVRLENERNQAERDRAAEMRNLQRTQERLLQIEEDRERRSGR